MLCPVLPHVSPGCVPASRRWGPTVVGLPRMGRGAVTANSLSASPTDVRRANGTGCGRGMSGGPFAGGPVRIGQGGRGRARGGERPIGEGQGKGKAPGLLLPTQHRSCHTPSPVSPPTSANFGLGCPPRLRLTTQHHFGGGSRTEPADGLYVTQGGPSPRFGYATPPPPSPALRAHLVTKGQWLRAIHRVAASVVVE